MLYKAAPTCEGVDNLILICLSCFYLRRSSERQGLLTDGGANNGSLVVTSNEFLFLMFLYWCRFSGKNSCIRLTGF